MSEGEIRAGSGEPIDIYLAGCERPSAGLYDDGEWCDLVESGGKARGMVSLPRALWLELARKILEREGAVVLEGEEARDHQQRVLLRRVLGNDLARRGPIEPLPHMDRTHRPQAT